jgi:hypothetical protein
MPKHYVLVLVCAAISLALQSNAVEDCMKLVSRGAAWTLSFWCLGLASVMLRYAAPDLAERYAHPQLSQYYIVFAPFWIGDLIAVSDTFT